MDLDTLQSFVKVVQAGSFTRAADALVTHKARLSRVVSGLEHELGVRLLERSTRSLSLTEVGREFYERAVGILASVEDARGAMQQSQGEPRGALRLTCGVEFGLIAVNGWVGSYLQRYPQVRADVEFTNRMVDIVHEGFDLAIRVGTLPDSSLKARSLGTLYYGLFAAPGYLRRHGTPSRPDELSEHAVLAFTGGNHAPNWELAQDGIVQRPDLKPRMKVNNVFAVRDAAAAGLGVARMPLVVARPLQAQGLLVPVLADWTSPTVPVHAVFASARYLAPKVRAFIDLAVAAMREVDTAKA
jgi:LysR family transcriptional regulator for bpeEF and oprC